MSLDIERAKESIDNVTYSYYGTTTICVIETKCGANFIGESHCFDRNDYKIEVGKEEAYKVAFSKFLDAEAYLQKTLRMILNFGNDEVPPPLSGGVL